MKPKKSLGQHFLKDGNMLRYEAEKADVKNKSVLEIGAGDGRLTEKIMAAGAKKITAIEIDSVLAEDLKHKFKTSENVKIICADFLELEFKEHFDVIMGNIPYYISSAIIFKLKDIVFDRAILIVQKEFAEKMVAKPNEKNYGRLSVTSQLFYTVKYIRTIPKALFSPPPRVDSAMIKLTKTDTRVTEFDEDVVRLLFQHKNQSVKKSLGHSKRFTKEQLSGLGDYSGRRIRTLSKEECLEISKLLKHER